MPLPVDQKGKPMWYRLMENDEGVHLTIGEFTLCGDSFDAPDSEGDWPAGQFRVPKRRTVTCKRCASIIRTCRGIRVEV